MKKATKGVLSALVLALALGGCSQGVTAEDLGGKTYQYEKEGFGGDFVITLAEDGTFTYYEGGLSSYIGNGDWTLEGETLTLQERTRHFTFRVGKDSLTFQKEDSGEFTYLKVEDGEKFTAQAE